MVTDGELLCVVYLEEKKNKKKLFQIVLVMVKDLYGVLHDTYIHNLRLN